MTPAEFYNNMMQIGDRFREMFSAAGSTSFIFANVVSVDFGAHTIDVRVGTEDSDLMISDISLAGPSGVDAAVYTYPKVGSAVIIGLPYKQPESAFVARFSEVSAVRIVYDLEASETGEKDVITVDKDMASVQRGKYSCTIQKNSIHLSCEDGADIELRDGKIIMNGGDLGGLININSLLYPINQFIHSYNMHTHTSPSGGGATSTPVAGGVVDTISSSDVEDTNVLH